MFSTFKLIHLGCLITDSGRQPGRNYYPPNWGLGTAVPIIDAMRDAIAKAGWLGLASANSAYVGLICILLRQFASAHLFMAGSVLQLAGYSDRYWQAALYNGGISRFHFTDPASGDFQ